MAEPVIDSLYANLPDNSRSGRSENKPAPAEEKRVEKIVKGKVTVKKNEMRRFTDIFILEDISKVKDYIIHDVLIPTLKETIYDIVTNSLDISLFGGRGSSSKRSRRSTADTVSYTNYGSMNRSDDRGRRTRPTIYSYDDIVIPTRGEAEAVLERMDELLETYEQVRVADLYELVGVTGEYTDNKYGWVNLQNADVVRVRNGYKIKLPRAVPLH